MRQFQTMSRGTEARDFNLLQDNAKYVQNWSAAQCFIVMLCTVVQVRYRTYLPSYLTALDLHPFAGGSGATIFSRSNSRFLGKIIKISRGYPSINKFLLFHSKFYIFVIGLFIYRPYLYFNIEIFIFDSTLYEFYLSNFWFYIYNYNNQVYIYNKNHQSSS